jgi:tRNA1(Val) A37 N6-methylase TrmN6
MQKPNDGANIMTAPHGKMVCSQDRFLDGRLLLRQPEKGHRIGTDALLLAAATQAQGRVCDLGSGVGAIGLALALRGCSDVVLVEKSPVFATLAQNNIQDNIDSSDCQMTAQVIQADVFDRRSFLKHPQLADQSFDSVATNPPYDQALKGRRSPTELKMIAHAMQGGDLDDWLKASVRLLKDGGVLTLIHRADRLHDVLSALPKRAGEIAVLPVHPKQDQAATRIMLRAVAGSKAGFSLLPPLILHKADGIFTDDAELIHKGQATLTMRPGPVIERI